MRLQNERNRNFSQKLPLKLSTIQPHSLVVNRSLQIFSCVSGNTLPVMIFPNNELDQV